MSEICTELVIENSHGVYAGSYCLGILRVPSAKNDVCWS